MRKQIASFIFFFLAWASSALLMQQKTNWLLTGDPEEAVQPIDGLQGEWPLCSAHTCWWECLFVPFFHRPGPRSPPTACWYLRSSRRTRGRSCLTLTAVLRVSSASWKRQHRWPQLRSTTKQGSKTEEEQKSNVNVCNLSFYFEGADDYQSQCSAVLTLQRGEARFSVATLRNVQIYGSVACHDVRLALRRCRPVHSKPHV